MECFQKYYIHNQEIKPCSDFDESLYAKGTSVYEVIRIEQGTALFLEDHLKRLFQSAHILNLKIIDSESLIKLTINNLVKINSVLVGKIKLMVHFDPVNNKQQDFLIYFNPHYFPTIEEYQNGVKTGLCKAIRENPNAKMLNTEARLKANHIIAEQKLFEVILMDNEGCITEGSRSNVLFISGNSVISAPEQDILQGIARKNVKRICNENNIEFIERNIKLNDLNRMDAMFLTGTSLKILPVATFEDFSFTAENPFLKRLMQLYDLEIEKYIEKFKVS
jgi:branched-chain amino acid aminotransferase